jgi:hypothetical protein
MTNPQPQQAHTVVNGGAQLMTGPDGKLHVGIVIAAGVTQFVVILPPDGAAQFVEKLADMVNQVALQARRQNAGLVTATPDQLTTLRGNGGGAPMFKTGR